MHHGVDLAVPKNTLMSSTVNGVVVFAGMGGKGSGYGGYGNTVAIRDKNGNVHVYGHLNKVNVQKGQLITKGTDIGLSGNTGNSFGAHLHYEVRKNGVLKNTIDPMQFLK